MEALKMQFSSIVIFLCRVCSSDFRCADTSSGIGRVDKLHAGANCYSCGRSALSDSAGTSTVPMMYHPPNTIMWNGKPARCLSPSTDFWPPCQNPLGPAGGRQCLVLYKQFGKITLRGGRVFALLPKLRMFMEKERQRYSICSPLMEQIVLHAYSTNLMSLYLLVLESI